MDIKKARLQSGMELAPVAKAIRLEFPGFDLYLLSKAENGGRYGIRLLPRAQELALAAMGMKKRSDRRRLPCRVYCRLSRTRYRRLQTAQEALGYASMQDAIADIIDAWLLSHEAEIARWESTDGVEQQSGETVRP